MLGINVSCCFAVFNDRRVYMKRANYTENPIVAILKQVGNGIAVAGVFLGTARPSLIMMRPPTQRHIMNNAALH